MEPYDIPEGAHWVAQDSNGEWWYYRVRPQISESLRADCQAGQWYGGMCGMVGFKSDATHWKDSPINLDELRERTNVHGS